MPRALARKTIRDLRPPHVEPDVWRPIGHQHEQERQADGEVADALTVFLAGRECPFTCVFCDLWRYTTAAPTPVGALPAQLRRSLDAVGPLPSSAVLKLYNASNFFDAKAVPPDDDDPLATLAAPFARVVVECHATLVGRRCFDFAERLRQKAVDAGHDTGGRLEVAVGLETVHPTALPLLGKRVTLDDFARAAERLATRSLALRSFVLVGAPYVPAVDDTEWVARSVAFAFEHGAEHVVLIPTRAGNGAMEQLATGGAWDPPSLKSVEAAFDHCLNAASTSAPSGVVTVDPWDLAPLATCASCCNERIARLERMNLSGRVESSIVCPACTL